MGENESVKTEEQNNAGSSTDRTGKAAGRKRRPKKKKAKRFDGILLKGSETHPLPPQIFRIFHDLDDAFPGSGKKHWKLENYVEDEQYRILFKGQTLTFTPKHCAFYVRKEISKVSGRPIYAFGMDYGKLHETASGARVERVYQPKGKVKKIYRLASNFAQVNRAIFRESADAAESGAVSASQRLLGGNVLVFDLEMQDGIPIQCSAALVEQTPQGFVQHERYDTYIRLPEGRKIDEFIHALTRISNADLEKYGVEPAEFVERMSLLLQKADFLCGHAVGNDLSSLARCFRSVGKDISKLTLGARIIDTADFGSLLLGIPNQTSLQHTGELLGVPQDGRAFHKADVDVDYTIKVLEHGIRALNAKFPETPIEKSIIFRRIRRKDLLSEIAELLAV